MASAYFWGDFVGARSSATSAADVFVSKGAMETAETDFSLTTQSAVIDFIGDGGCERPTYIRTEPFHNWKAPPPPPSVDSYSFYSGPKFGYLAFMRNRTTGVWTIKSFKKNEQFGGFFPLAAALKLKGILG